jgi:hypothetical protein
LLSSGLVEENRFAGDQEVSFLFNSRLERFNICNISVVFDSCTIECKIGALLELGGWVEGVFFGDVVGGMRSVPIPN